MNRFSSPTLLPALLVSACLLLCATNVHANDDEWDDWQETPSSPWSYNGFVQGKVGRFLSSQPQSTNFSARDLTLRLETQYEGELFQAQFKADSQYLLLKSDWQHQVRELAVSVDLANSDNETISDSALAGLSFKVGRQSLSWGLGEFIFLNDLFAKDWQSFFNGDDISYLKKPNDALKLSYFFGEASLDVVYQTQHSVDNLYQPISGLISPSDSSIHARYYFSSGQTDYAFYASDGIGNTPLFIAGSFEYQQLKSLGASMIKPLAGGLFKAEFSNYWLDNSLAQSSKQQRYLIGFEREIMPRLNLSLQAYLEQDSNPYASHTLDNRQLITTSFNYRSSDDNWNNQVMLFHSPNHHDNYLRISSSYRYSDQIILSGHINNLNGHSDTFFGQLKAIDNAALRITFYF